MLGTMLWIRASFRYEDIFCRDKFQSLSSAAGSAWVLYCFNGRCRCEHAVAACMHACVFRPSPCQGRGHPQGRGSRPALPAPPLSASHAAAEVVAAAAAGDANAGAAALAVPGWVLARCAGALQRLRQSQSVLKIQASKTSMQAVTPRRTMRPGGALQEKFAALHLADQVPIVHRGVYGPDTERINHRALIQLCGRAMER